MSERWCIVSDGDSRWYLCPVERAEEAAAMLEAVVRFWDEEPDDRNLEAVPPHPDFVLEMGNPFCWSFADPQEDR